jgi:hypothetical protein
MNILQIEQLLAYVNTLPKTCTVTQTGETIGLEYPNSQTIVCNFVFDQDEKSIIAFAKLIGNSPATIMELASKVIELSADRSDLIQAFGISFNSLLSECNAQAEEIIALREENEKYMKQIIDLNSTPTVGEK